MSFVTRFVQVWGNSLRGKKTDEGGAFSGISLLSLPSPPTEEEKQIENQSCLSFEIGSGPLCVGISTIDRFGQPTTLWWFYGTTHLTYNNNLFLFYFLTNVFVQYLLSIRNFNVRTALSPITPNFQSVQITPFVTFVSSALMPSDLYSWILTYDYHWPKQVTLPIPNSFISFSPSYLNLSRDLQRWAFFNFFPLFLSKLGIHSLPFSLIFIY